MWIYKVVVGIILDEAELNLIGADGWELVTIEGNTMFFKKPSV